MMLTTLIIGLLGAILMFCGDMTLYYDPKDYQNDGTLEPIINIMKTLPKKRVMLGGLLGPIAAFLYCIGFYHIVIMTEENYVFLAMISFLCNSLGIIAGGAYHSHCAYLGLLGDDAYREALNIVEKYFQKIAIILYGGEGIGMLILIILIILGKTMLPLWMVVVSPGVLFLLKPLVRKLPKGLHMVISGGYSNLIFILYYAVTIVLYCVL